MDMVRHSWKLRVLGTRLFGVVLTMLAVVVAVTVSTPVAASTPAAGDASQTHAGDDCEDACPGELPDGHCAENCQYCACCGTFAFSVLPSLVVVSSSLIPSAQNSLVLPSHMPTGVAAGIFKPPRHISV